MEASPHILASPLYYQMEASPLYIYIHWSTHTLPDGGEPPIYIYIYTGALIPYQMEASPQLDMVVEPRLV